MEDLIIKEEEFTDYISVLEEIQESIESELDSLIGRLSMTPT